MQTPPPTVSKKALWIGWILSVLPCLMLFMSAGMKLSKPPAVVEEFVKMGFPEQVVFGLGVVELVCTILYLVPQTAVLGAILLTGYLGGAICTHLRVSEPYFVQILFGVALWGGLFLRDPRLRVLIPLRR